MIELTRNTQNITEHNLFAGRLTERKARVLLKRMSTSKLDHSIACLEDLGGRTEMQQAVLDFYKGVSLNRQNR